MTYAIQAAEALAGEGIDVEVIDLRTIRPMDLDTVIASVQKTNRLVTVEEGFPQSSVGDHIASQVMQCWHLIGSMPPRRYHLRQGRADALCGQSGKTGAAECRRSGRCGESRILQGVREFRHANQYYHAALSPTMEEGNLAKWLVKEGDSVAPR